jgi:predicted DNA-binding protein
MRKKQEYVNKNFRLDKEADDRLKELRHDSGATERHLLNEAVRVLLAAKGY